MNSDIKFFVVFILCVIFSFSVFSQDKKEEKTEGQEYKTGIGIRFGGLTSGLTVKHFTNPSAALEGILSFGYRSFIITGLYEKHNAVSDASSLKWFYGIGAHIGFFQYDGRYY
jgi:hypothetical protein